MKAPRIGFVSLGCPKALVDSERILTRLRSEGYDIASTYKGADLVVVNTCGFIDSARMESLQAIGEAIDENGRVIVTGCLGVNESDIRSVHPGVLQVTGPQQYEKVIEAVHEYAPGAEKHDPFIDLVPEQGIKLTPRHYAYLKIAEGCNHKCTFCIIPSMRGRLVSRSLSSIMLEAEALVEAGVRELLVISQDTSAFGSDTGYRPALWRGEALTSDLFSLVRSLGSLGVWVRLHYVYPYPHVDRVIPFMANGELLPYLDIPFQHGSPSVLRRMKRPAAAEDNLLRILKWREICPDITVRSTFIVGFPGETEQEFQELLDFIEAARLDRVGCFQYSPVKGARANELERPVEEGVKQHRYEKFMETQARISREKLQLKKGRIIDVLVDEVKGEQVIGRSHADAPEIDGNVYFESDRLLCPGDLVKVHIESAGDYDLWGKHAEDQLSSGSGVAM